MEASRYKLLWAFMFLAAAVSLLGLVLVRYMKSEEDICKLLELEPAASWPSQRNLVSQDLKAIANFDGYLSYQTGPIKADPFAKYLPLTLRQVRVRQTESGLRLDLGADCAKISLYLDLKSNETQVTTTDIQLDLKVATKEGISICHIWHPFITSTVDKHYTCSLSKSYDCKTEDKNHYLVQQLELVVNVIEFEVNGNPELLSRGLFSTPSSYC